MLVVFSGLPGSGKSAVAEAVGRELGIAVIAVDPIEAAIWRAGVTPSFETGVAAYEVAAAIAEQQVRLGLDVIVDAVNSVSEARASWHRVAGRTGAALAVVEVICSDESEHRRRLETRVRDIEGFPEPTWADVNARRATWEEWPVDHLVLDSHEPLEVNVTHALRYLASPAV